MPNAFASWRETGNRGHGHPSPVLQVLRDHLPRVHPVHVIGADDHHDVRPLVVDQVHRLEDRVSRPAVPVRAEPLLRGHRRHVVAEEVTHPPRHRDMPVQAVALVLREHADLPDAGVGQVGQREVHQPVHPAERHRRFSPVVRQRRQPRPRPARQHDSQHPRVRHVVPSLRRYIRLAMKHPLTSPAEPRHARKNGPIVIPPARRPPPASSPRRPVPRRRPRPKPRRRPGTTYATLDLTIIVTYDFR